MKHMSAHTHCNLKKLSRKSACEFTSNTGSKQYIMYSTKISKKRIMYTSNTDSVHANFFTNNLVVIENLNSSIL